MNKTQAEHRVGEVMAAMYWHDRGTFPLEGGQEEYAKLTAEMTEIAEKLAAGEYPPETNERGCIVERDLIQHGSRYPLDFGLNKGGRSGWQQYDTNQDAHYFGIWVNLRTLQVITYCEGDLTLTSAHCYNAMWEELQSMAAFYLVGIVATVSNDIGLGSGGIVPKGISQVIYGDTVTTADLLKVYKEDNDRFLLSDPPKDTPLTMAELIKVAEGKH